MASVRYTFTKSPVSPNGLSDEIRSSPITAALDRIETVGSTLYIYFRVALSPEDEARIDAIVEAHTGSFKPTESPADIDGAPLVRTKAAAPGWSLQLHSVEVKTSTVGGVYNKRVNPATGEEIDLGFATIKLFDALGNEITDPANEEQCVHTRVDWRTTHDIELRGAAMAQSQKPNQTCRMWAVGAPGLANVFFCQGGMNLQNFDPGQFVTAEGVAAKYLSATKPIPGANTMRLIYKHAAGLKHTMQLLLYIYAP